MIYQCTHATLEIFDDTILKDVSLTIEAGIYYHLSGPNGVGKTLLIQSLMGLNKYLPNFDINNFPHYPITYIPDSPFFLDNDTVAQVLLTVSFFYNVSYLRALRIFKSLNLDEVNVPRKRIAQLSLGTQQKLALIPLFLRNNGIFVLDEIFSGLDTSSQSMVINRLNQLHEVGSTLILIEHNEAIITKIKTTSHLKEILCTPQTTTNLD